MFPVEVVPVGFEAMSTSQKLPRSGECSLDVIYKEQETLGSLMAKSTPEHAPKLGGGGLENK